MRQTLAAFMAYRDENAYGLESRSGVPQATINRYLTGRHANLSIPNAKKIAEAYGLTESQLRGDVVLSKQQQTQLLIGSKKVRFDLMVKLGVTDPLQIQRQNPLVTDELLELHAFIEELGHHIENDVDDANLPSKVHPSNADDSSNVHRDLQQLSNEEQVLLEFFKNAGRELKDAMLRMAGHNVAESIPASPNLAISKYTSGQRSTGKKSKSDVG